MSQDLYSEDHWKDIPQDFWSFEHLPDGVRYTSYFFRHFLSRIGYCAGATLDDPATLAQILNVPADLFPAIIAFLERHGFISVNRDGSITLTKRGEEWYGFSEEFHQQMMWHIDRPTWHNDIAGIHDCHSYDDFVDKLNERHAPLLRQFAALLVSEAIRDRSVEALRYGILAAAVGIALANDGSRPGWIPSPDDFGEVLGSLFHAAGQLGVDPAGEFTVVASQLSGTARSMIGNFTAST